MIFCIPNFFRVITRIAVAGSWMTEKTKKTLLFFVLIIGKNGFGRAHKIFHKVFYHLLPPILNHIKLFAESRYSFGFFELLLVIVFLAWQKHRGLLFNALLFPTDALFLLEFNVFQCG